MTDKKKPAVSSHTLTVLEAEMRKLRGVMLQNDQHVLDAQRQIMEGLDALKEQLRLLEEEALNTVPQWAARSTDRTNIWVGILAFLIGSLATLVWRFA